MIGDFIETPMTENLIGFAACYAPETAEGIGVTFMCMIKLA